MLEQPENLVIPQRENSQVRSISREVDHAWLAGIVDGEGAISLDLKLAGNGKLYLMPKIRIYNTDVLMIKKISRIYIALGVVFFYNLNKKRAETWKNQLGICVTSQGSCIKVLDAIEPYLANKQEHAGLMRAIIAYVQGFPKGGNTVAHDYTQDQQFQEYMKLWRSTRAAHIDPSTTERRANNELVW